ncbi:MAG: hypothetical protein IJQ02_09385 [Oscillospiraceae bacterium]|nr:hypothetical protein [Oscillospiraceae bacterium]
MYYKTNDPTRNGEGYRDMTAYLALQRIEMEAQEARRMKNGGRRAKRMNCKDAPRGKKKNRSDC